MSEEFQENLIAYIQKFLPFVTSALWVLFSYIPLDSAVANNLRPDMGLMCVFFGRCIDQMFLTYFQCIFWA